MGVIQFYHLTSTPMERAVPKLVEKAYEAGFRVHLLLANDEQAEYMNQQLWTFSTLSFVPHGTRKDHAPEIQPVFLSASLEAPNAPDLLFVTEGTSLERPEQYKRILDMFDGNSAEAVEKARTRWKQYKDAGNEVSYFKQTDKGAWEKAA